MKSKRAREAEAPVEDAKPADIQKTTAADEQPAKKRKRTDDGADADSPKKSKKDKKEKKDKKKDKSKYSKENRKEKKEKRKDLQDLPEDNGDDDEVETEVPATKVKEEKKKSKKADKKEASASAAPAAPAAETPEAKSESKKSKKNKDKKKNADQSQTSTESASAAVPAGASNGIDLDVDGTKAGANGTATTDENNKDKADRHIVFVGNLPYSATAASISAHFASLSPIAVRCLTNKGADSKNTCRGIAFIEFANVWSQRTCLDKFHHSSFEDGISAPRKINVELTAGGGGKTKHRQDKIRDKNIKLDENRAKRIEKEKNTKAENAGNGSSQQEQQSAMEDAIHPSRRARVPGNRW